MGLRNVFQKAAVTALNAFGDVTQDAYYVETIDDGFGDSSSTSYPVKIIYDTFTDAEASRFSFASLIQVKDKKGLVPALSVDVAIHSNNQIKDTDDVLWSIIAKEMDAADAMYILLLRKV